MTDKDKKELDHYRIVFGTGDIATRGYKTVVKMLEQQITYLDTVEIKNIVNSDDKSKVIEYKNAKEMWEGMPDMILKLHKLKNELGIEYVEKEEEYTPVSPQSIGKLTYK